MDNRGIPKHHRKVARPSVSGSDWDFRRSHRWSAPTFCKLMHELSIAVSLVELACDEARRLSDATVSAVHVRLGALAGVVKDPLLFSFDLAKQETEISTARLEIQEVPVTVWCSNCAAERDLHDVHARRCPVCNAVTPQILRGNELELFAIEVQDGRSDR